MTIGSTGPVLPVSTPGKVRVDRPDRLLLVADPALGDVTCRWRLTPGPHIWRCSVCGPQAGADCAHTFSAAIELATTLLGLRRAEVTPTTEGNPS